MKRIIFAAIAAVMLLPATALARDSNGDKLPDRWERSFNLSLKKDQARRDQDKDGVRNRAEFKHGMSPRDDDSDGDGTEDGSEAGRVTSFDTATGTLVITLIDGSALSGTVNDSTEIECGASDDATAITSSDDEESDDQSGDDSSGHGDDQSGDDNSGHGDDQSGDDNSGSGDDDEGDDDGDHHGDHHGDDDDVDEDANCSTSALTIGALVHEAQLKATSTGAVWDEIELV
jgi:hypothetical protein